MKEQKNIFKPSTECVYSCNLASEFTPHEISQLAQVKRFFEWSKADADFNAELISGKLSTETQKRLHDIGILFDPDELALLWKNPETVAKFFVDCHQPDLVEISAEEKQLCARYPLFELWLRQTRNAAAVTKSRIKNNTNQSLSIPDNPQIDAWRKRRIASGRSELGYFGYVIDHPILAYELGNGCSVGCWFCAFASNKLIKNFDYSENREVTDRIIQVCIDLFGKEGAGLALPYYGTEPHDNPNYIDFLRQYEKMTGYPLCTSTAFPTDAKWLRELLAFYHDRDCPLPWPRLSVLSKSMLLKIHDLYTPEELVHVELLMQLKDDPRKKVTGGRILEEQSGLRGLQPEQFFEQEVPQGSISCVSGFLINFVKLTIQVVSPCYTTKRWPYGYRVFDETTFKLEAEDFRDTVEKLIERNMPTSFPKTELMQFREDLKYEEAEKGFKLTSPNQVHHFNNAEIHIPLGFLISEGKHTFDDIMDIMQKEHAANPMVLLSVLNSLFDKGFLNEIYNHTD